MTKKDMCSRYISIQNEIKDLKEEMDNLKEKLRSDLEDDFRKNRAASATYGDYTVSMKEQVRTVTDTQHLREQGLFEQYSKPSIVEVFKVTHN
jgi:hypothetical protein